LKIQQVQECVSSNSITNVENKDEILKKQREAANCLRTKLAAVPEGDLTKLGEKLQLDAYGVVKGKSNQALVNYLSGRLEKALYGAEGGKVVNLGKQKIVDQKVFVDIYETQLGKNILLEVSNYCFNRLDITSSGGQSRLKELSLIGANGIDAKISALKDETPMNSAFSLTDADNIYEKIKDDLKKVTENLVAPKTPAEALNDLFLTCARAIPKMCEYYEDCLCKFKLSKPQDYPNTPACNPNTKFQCAQTTFNGPPTKGSHSCHVASRLRGYRTNLEAVKTTKDRFDKEYGSLENTKEYKDIKQSYNKANTRPNESIDDLTSITTSDVDEALKVNELSNEIGAIPDDCATNPENPECEKFFYKQSEVQKFAQSSAGYSAATLVSRPRSKI